MLADVVRPQGSGLLWAAKLADLIRDENGSSLPRAARDMLRVMLSIVDELDRKIADLDKEITRRAREDEVARRRACQ